MTAQRRYGAGPELELDSLADRLATDEALRRQIKANPSPAGHEGRRTFQDRVARLAGDLGTTYDDQLATVIRRATELAQARASA